VTKWGLSDKLGAQLYTEEEQGSYLGGGGGGQMSHLSDETARTIDSEVSGLLKDCYDRAEKILQDNRDKLELMKDALMEYETIDSKQIDDIMNGEKPRPPQSWSDDDKGGPAPVAEEVDLDVSDSNDAEAKPSADPASGS
jgi:cell division protease FtsH